MPSPAASVATRIDDVLVLRERLLDLAALLAADAAVDRDDRLGPAEQRAELVDEVVEGVAVLGEDDQLPPLAGGVEHLGCGLQELDSSSHLRVGARVADPLGRVAQGR